MRTLQYVSCAALVLSLTACGLEVPLEEQGAAGAPSELDSQPVAVTAEALGAWSTLWSSTTRVLKHQSSKYFVAVTWGPGVICANAEVGLVADGSTLPPVPQGFPGCLRQSASYTSDDNGVFAINEGKLYRLVLGAQPSWLTLASSITTADNPAMALDATYVYWQDNATIRRAPRAGGNATKVAAIRTLLAIDGAFLYAQQKVGDEYRLRKLATNGSTDTLLSTLSTDLTTAGFSFDSTHFYWVEDLADGSHRIQRLTKDGVTLSTIKSSATSALLWPRSNGSALYWIEATDVVTAELRRKNLSNNNSIGVALPYQIPSSFVLKSDRVSIAFGLGFLPGEQSHLVRGDL